VVLFLVDDPFPLFQVIFPPHVRQLDACSSSFDHVIDSPYCLALIQQGNQYTSSEPASSKDTRGWLSYVQRLIVNCSRYKRLQAPYNTYSIALI